MDVAQVRMAVGKKYCLLRRAIYRVENSLRSTGLECAVVSRFGVELAKGLLGKV